MQPQPDWRQSTYALNVGAHTDERVIGSLKRAGTATYDVTELMAYSLLPRIQHMASDVQRKYEHLSTLLEFVATAFYDPEYDPADHYYARSVSELTKRGTLSFGSVQEGLFY